MKDLGYKCLKDSYMRHGTEWKCPDGEEQSGDLCYPKCKAGEEGHGPVCYGACPEGTTECGPLCLREGEFCTEELQATVNHVYPMIVDFAEHTKAGTFVDISLFSTDLIHPSCDAPEESTIDDPYIRGATHDPSPPDKGTSADPLKSVSDPSKTASKDKGSGSSMMPSLPTKPSMPKIPGFSKN